VPVAPNDRLCEHLGATRECLLRDGLAAAAWPDEARAAVAAVAAGGRAARETTVRGIAGRAVPATVTATRLAVAADPGLLVVEVRDATERELAFDTISILDERLRGLAEAAPVAFWSTDVDGRTTYTSPRWAQISGQPVEAALVHGWRDVVHPDDRELVEHAWRDWHPDQGDARNLEYRIVRPDGSVRHIVDANRRVYDADGRLMGYAGASMDVTESRSDRQRLGRIADRNAALAELGRRALEHGTSFEDLLRAAVAAVATALDADFASVGRLTEDGQHHELVSLFVRDVGEVPTGQRIPVGRYSQAGLAMVQRRPVATADVAHEERYDTTQLVEHGVRASLAVPILPAGRVYGSLGAHYLQPRSIEEDEIHFAVAVANIVAGLDERLRAEEEQRRAALVDPLTGLANRIVIRDVIARALQAGERSHPAVLLVDVDHITHVNHAYGQSVGDELLVEIGRRMVAVVGASGTVGRLASDEFVVVAGDGGASVALLAERLLEAFGEPFELRRGPLTVSASIGVATARDDDATADSLLRGAEAAAGAAKTRGRARLEWYDRDLGLRARTQVETALALRRAVEDRELVLVYQPVVHLTSGATDGFEALVRWRREGEANLVTPDRFVPIAEETGLIAQIGRWVVAEACRQLGRWNEARGDRLLRVSVNVSARELGRADFAEGILRSLEDAGVDPAQLGLELTESALVEESEAALAALDAVRAAGVRLLIDDFGTGYASLSYLKRFRPDELKLDRSFVTGLGEEGADTTIVAAIVGMAHALGLVVTGEGVERPEQLRALRALGCERAQGFLFARPAEAGAIDPVHV
jgi:diguanylate cyclase (GGDEF)-like protein/PAS domain S-box-containing protein